MTQLTTSWRAGHGVKGERGARMAVDRKEIVQESEGGREMNDSTIDVGEQNTWVETGDGC